MQESTAVAMETHSNRPLFRRASLPPSSALPSRLPPSSAIPLRFPPSSAADAGVDSNSDASSRVFLDTLAYHASMAIVSDDEDTRYVSNGTIISTTSSAAAGRQCVCVNVEWTEKVWIEENMKVTQRKGMVEIRG